MDAHILDLFPNLLRGAIVTVEVTVAASLLALALSLPVALGRLSRAWPLRMLSGVYVEVLRGTSALVQLFYLFFILPLVGIRLDPLPTAIVGLGLNFSAYGSEIVRGAILGVDHGQWEAAAALQFSRAAALRRIVLPQAVAVMLPSFASLLIQLLKSTALVSLITLNDLTFAGQTLITTTGQPFAIWGLVLTIYYVLAMPLEWAAARLESVPPLTAAPRIKLITPVQFDLAFAWSILPDLLRGAAVTAEATFGGMALAMAGGLLLALARRAGRGPLAATARGYISAVRNTPLLVQLSPSFTCCRWRACASRRLPPASSLLACTTAPSWRRFIALGSRRCRTANGKPLRRSDSRGTNLTQHHMPQAIPPMVPVFGNFLIGTFKDTPLLATITIPEMFGAAERIAGETYRYNEPFTLVGLTSWRSAILPRWACVGWSAALPQNDPLVRFRAVRKAFGSNVVLEHFDLDVADGERIALIGPSGSGKTTVLRLLMGLDGFDGGEIELGGVALSRPTRRPSWRGGRSAWCFSISTCSASDGDAQRHRSAAPGAWPERCGSPRAGGGVAQPGGIARQA